MSDMTVADFLASNLEYLLNHYVELAKSDVGGKWDPEQEIAVKGARQALRVYHDESGAILTAINAAHQLMDVLMDEDEWPEDDEDED